MSIKRMSLRFNLDNKADRKAWKHLKNVTDSKNKAVITAVNQFYEPHAEITERALGYAPRTVQPEAFFHFYTKLCELCNTTEITPETENKLLMLIDEIHSEFLLPRKEDMREWRQQDSGQSKTS